uniref:Discoidin, CUB and LCCL domain containing 2 n=1 Tax=Oryzias melastigma TaxID=30732 RepID=A0A3B3DGE7_ORYME
VLSWTVCYGLAILTTDLVQARGDGCGPSVLGPSSGTLSSRGYPGTYPNDSVCEWEISVPPKKRIHFRFALLDIEDNNCQVNYLRLYNGIGSKRSEIEKYCGLGLKVEKLIETSDHKATVQFRSGTHHTGRGFYLSYSTTDHPDLITCLDKGTDFSEAEFSKYCPAGCSTSAEEVSGTIPKGYREVSWGAFLSLRVSFLYCLDSTACMQTSGFHFHLCSACECGFLSRRPGGCCGLDRHFIWAPLWLRSGCGVCFWSRVHRSWCVCSSHFQQ